ncbi:hypothetical protein L798_14997, partial [Zootermopsis nevadensis]
MAYRGIKGSDPFASKTTRNERFAQMSKQEQLIEQKKREIQAKLEDQKKKETEEALKKLQGASDQRWKRDSSHSEDTSSSKASSSVNIFSNDGSFLDQFKKLSAWHGQDSPSPPQSRSATTAPNRPSSPYSPSSATDTKEVVPLINITPSARKGPIQYSLPSIHPSSIMPLLNPPQQHFMTYSSPPPPLHSIPPPSPMQPHTIPTPPPLAPALNLHPSRGQVIQQPPPAIQQPPPTLQPPPSMQPISPHLMQHPPPLLQRHTFPPPAVLQTQTLGPARPPTLMTPLLQHPLPPPDRAADEAVNHLARTVAQCGDDIEQIILTRNPDDPALWFLHDKGCAAYLQYRQLVEKICTEMKSTDRREDAANDEKKDEVGGCLKQEHNEYGPINFQQENTSSKRSGDDSDEGQATVAHRRKRRSRWAPETEKVTVMPETGGNGPAVTMTLGLVQPVVAEDHYKINLLYQDMLRKRQELERLQRAGKFKYEYDSDEETDGGTWEHRLRLQEMEATQRWAEELTKKAEGKHHIGDFLPPDELERFLEKYNALKEGREPDLSDYKEFKLKEDNIGFQMLQKLGWTEGQGLGSEGHG